MLVMPVTDEGSNVVLPAGTWIGLTGVWGSALKCSVASVALLQTDTLLTTTGWACCATRNAMSKRYKRMPARVQAGRQKSIPAMSCPLHCQKRTA